MKLMQLIFLLFHLQDATQGNIRFNRTGNSNYASNGKNNELEAISAVNRHWPKTKKENMVKRSHWSLRHTEKCRNGGMEKEDGRLLKRQRIISPHKNTAAVQQCAKLRNDCNLVTVKQMLSINLMDIGFACRSPKLVAHHFSHSCSKVLQQQKSKISPCERNNAINFYHKAN